MSVIVTIDTNLCKGCNICITQCPKNVFAQSVKRSRYGTPMPKAVNENECIICRQCEKLCPDAAINVEEIKRV
jgi:2-oxoglutarate ferredoxin oxidoreductase subunit delta